MRTMRSGFAVVMLCTVWGCGNRGPQPVDVKGAVTFEGAPVEEGTITFYDPATETTEQSPLGPGGTYAVNILPGQYRVVIEPIMVQVQAGPEIAPETTYKRVDNIPSRYRRAETSTLTAPIDGPAELSFEMKR